MVAQRRLAPGLTIVALAALTGCAGDPPDGAAALAAEAVSARPRPESFTYCHDHGCTQRKRLAFSPAQWETVRAPLALAARDADEERRQIATSIAAFERAAGALAGTARDRGGTFEAFGTPGQLDCADESVNTTVALSMLAAEGLLRWHDTGPVAGRGNMLAGEWPHRSATVVEKMPGTWFAVDSWFGDNGAPPAVVPLEQWLAGWRPSADAPPR